MPKKKVFTLTHARNNPQLFRKAIPFDLTWHGKVICTVIHPGGIWRECENCGENTQNIEEFRDKRGEWRKLILCDKCADELL